MGLFSVQTNVIDKFGDEKEQNKKNHCSQFIYTRDDNRETES